MSNDEDLRELVRVADLPRLVVLEADSPPHPSNRRYYVSAHVDRFGTVALDPLDDLGIWTHEGVTTKAIAEYIAAACNEVPRLLDEAERLRRGWDQATDLGAARESALNHAHAALEHEQSEHVRRVMLDAAKLAKTELERDALQRRLELAEAVIKALQVVGGYGLDGPVARAMDAYAAVKDPLR